MIAATAAAKGLSEGIRAAQTDIFVLRGKTKPRRKQTPLDWEFHLNPLGIAVMAVGAGLTLAMLQLRAKQKSVKVVQSKWLDFTVTKDNWLGSVEAYVPTGWTLDKVVNVGETFVETSEMRWLSFVAAGGIGPYLLGGAADVLDIPITLPRVATVTPIIVHHPATTEWQSLGEHGKMEVTIPAWDEYTGFQVHAKIYAVDEPMITKWSLAERKSLVDVSPI